MERQGIYRNMRHTIDKTGGSFLMEMTAHRNRTKNRTKKQQFMPKSIHHFSTENLCLIPFRQKDPNDREKQWIHPLRSPLNFGKHFPMYITNTVNIFSGKDIQDMRTNSQAIRSFFTYSSRWRWERRNQITDTPWHVWTGVEIWTQTKHIYCEQ